MNTDDAATPVGSAELCRLHVHVCRRVRKRASVPQHSRPRDGHPAAAPQQHRGQPPLRDRRRRFGGEGTAAAIAATAATAATAADGTHHARERRVGNPRDAERRRQRFDVHISSDQQHAFRRPRLRGWSTKHVARREQALAQSLASRACACGEDDYLTRARGDRTREACRGAFRGAAACRALRRRRLRRGGGA